MQKPLYEHLYIMGVIFMAILLMETTQAQELMNEGVPEQHIRDIMRGFMGDKQGSELDAKVQYLNSLPGCYGLIIELFELFGKYPNYTEAFRNMEAAIAKAEKEAAKKQERENYSHRLASKQHVAQQKELRKILKGGC